MASTGYTIAGTGASDTSFGFVAWTNTGNIVSDNASYVTALNVADGATTHYLFATNFGFAIPTAAVISGVQVRIERYYSVDSGSPFVRDHSVQLVIGGVRSGTQKTFANWVESTPTIQDAGGVNDLWGNTLTPAIVNASNFGVAVRARNDTIPSQADLFIDYISINVHYGLGRSQIRIID